MEMEAVEEAQAAGDASHQAQPVEAGEGPALGGRLGPAGDGEHGEEQDEEVGEEVPGCGGESEGGEVDA